MCLCVVPGEGHADGPGERHHEADRPTGPDAAPRSAHRQHPRVGRRQRQRQVSTSGDSRTAYDLFLYSNFLTLLHQEGFVCSKVINAVSFAIVKPVWTFHWPKQPALIFDINYLSNY